MITLNPQTGLNKEINVYLELKQQQNGRKET